MFKTINFIGINSEEAKTTQIDGHIHDIMHDKVKIALYLENYFLIYLWYRCMYSGIC